MIKPILSQDKRDINEINAKRQYKYTLLYPYTVYYIQNLETKAATRQLKPNMLTENKRRNNIQKQNASSTFATRI